jgi:hypothetical protein
MSSDQRNWTPEERERYIAELWQAQAEKQPKPAQPERSWISRHPLWFGAIVLLSVFVGLILIGMWAEQEESPLPEPEDQAPVDSTSTVDRDTATPSEPSIVIDVAALHRAFEENEIKANAQYEGLCLGVVGYITHIGQDEITDEGIVDLASSPEKIWAEVRCEFPDPKPLLALKNGDCVVAVGTCTGEMVGTVYIHECNLIESVDTKPEPTTPREPAPEPFTPVTLRGNGSRATQPFAVPGEWILEWYCEPADPAMWWLIVSLHPRDSQVVIDYWQIEEKRGSTYVYYGPAECYLDVECFAVESWQFRVRAP